MSYEGPLGMLQRYYRRAVRGGTSGWRDGPGPKCAVSQKTVLSVEIVILCGVSNLLWCYEGAQLLRYVQTVKQ